MYDSSSIQLLWARCAKRCFLYLTLCLVALGTWSLPVPEPLAAAGDFNIFEHFLSDQSGAVSQHELVRPGPPSYSETDEGGEPAIGSASPGLLLGLTADKPRRPWPSRLLKPSPYRPQTPRAPPALS